MRSYLKMLVPGLASFLAVFLLVAPSAAGEGIAHSTAPEDVRARWLMGTVLEVRLAGGRPDAGSLAEAVFAAVSEVESAASLWRPGTELGEVHARTAAGEAVVVSETLGGLVLEALRAAELTGGAYSPAVGALVSAYDLRGDGRRPSELETRHSAALADPQRVRYDPATRRLRLSPGVTLDLDGIAKGFALDRAAATLRARGVGDALLNFGGQLLAVGPPPGAPAREVLVASPADPAVPVLAVRLRDASLSTSANSERVRTVAGVEAGHLLDPRTGDLVPFAGSVSVLAASGALADALSTAWAVEGPGRFRRSDPGSPLRRAGEVAFALPDRGGGCETLADLPFERLRPPAGIADAAVPGP